MDSCAKTATWVEFRPLYPRIPHFSDLRVTWEVPRERDWLLAGPLALCRAWDLMENSRHHLKHDVAATTVIAFVIRSKWWEPLIRDNCIRAVRGLRELELMFPSSSNTSHTIRLQGTKDWGTPHSTWWSRAPVQPGMCNQECTLSKILFNHLVEVLEEVRPLLSPGLSWTLGASPSRGCNLWPPLS